MKNYLNILFFALMLATVSSCTEEDDTTLPNAFPPIYNETFTRVAPVPAFSFENWTLFAEAGSKQWFKTSYQAPGAPKPNDYIEFSSFQGQASNIGWAISPAINLDTITVPAIKKRLVFKSAQHHATSLDNKFELLVSTNYDGTNVLAATWTVLPFRLPKYSASTNYAFVSSGGIDLSGYAGKIYIAFRVTGNSTNLAGGFQVDNLNIF